MAIGSLDDLHLPASGRGNGLCHFGALVAAVSENPLDEGKAAPGPAQQVMHTVAILNIGSMDAHAEQEAECFDENVALAARNFLAFDDLKVLCHVTMWHRKPLSSTGGLSFPFKPPVAVNRTWRRHFTSDATTKRT